MPSHGELEAFMSDVRTLQHDVARLEAIKNTAISAGVSPRAAEKMEE